MYLKKKIKMKIEVRYQDKKIANVLIFRGIKYYTMVQNQEYMINYTKYILK